MTDTRVRVAGIIWPAQLAALEAAGYVVVERSQIRHLLMEEWRELRNNTVHIDCAVSFARLLHRIGLLSEDECELWERRLSACPGHDDEGGRSWCGYCGDMPASKES